MIHAFDHANYFQPGKIKLEVATRAIGSRKNTKAGSNTRTGQARTVLNASPLRHVAINKDIRP